MRVNDQSVALLLAVPQKDSSVLLQGPVCISSIEPRDAGEHGGFTCSARFPRSGHTISIKRISGQTGLRSIMFWWAGWRLSLHVSSASWTAYIAFRTTA